CYPRSRRPLSSCKLLSANLPERPRPPIGRARQTMGWHGALFGCASSAGSLGARIEEGPAGSPPSLPLAITPDFNKRDTICSENASHHDQVTPPLPHALLLARPVRRAGRAARRRLLGGEPHGRAERAASCGSSPTSRVQDQDPGGRSGDLSEFGLPPV